jgi:hypothetical protein
LAQGDEHPEPERFKRIVGNCRHEVSSYLRDITLMSQTSQGAPRGARKHSPHNFGYSKRMP